ncbi:hypothetical protein ACOSQ3_031490 [Xanthoceras sorbifolium]
MELFSSQSISKKAAKQEKLHRLQEATVAAATVVSSLSVEKEGSLANKSDESWRVDGIDEGPGGVDSWLDPHDPIHGQQVDVHCVEI